MEGSESSEARSSNTKGTEGSESSEARSSNSEGNGRNSYLGVNRLHVGKVVKRSRRLCPIYKVDKYDFRRIVQQLTGCPVAPQPPPPPLPPPRNPAPSRLQRARPPPLQYVSSFNRLVSNPSLAAMNSVSSSFQPKQQHVAASATISAASCAPDFAAAAAAVSSAMPLPSLQNSSSSGLSLPIYSPFQSLAPSRAVWANPGPKATVPHETDQSSFGVPLQFPRAAVTSGTGQKQTSSPLSPLFLPYSPAENSQQQFPYVSPLPSPGSQFELSQLLAGLQVPFSLGSFVPLSPAEQFQFG